jgi:two-component system NtrC family sensor kinase
MMIRFRSEEPRSALQLKLPAHVPILGWRQSVSNPPYEPMGATSPHYQSTPPEDRPAAPPAPTQGRPEAREPFGLLDELPGAVLLLDPVGRVVYLNGIAELRLDVVRTEAVGRDFFREVVPRLEATGVGEQFRSAMLAGRASLACEVVLERSQGARRLGLGIRSYAHGGTLGAVVLVEDRSALAAEESRRQRAERFAAVGELATGVAHEINNPLASIKGFAQLLSRDLDSDNAVQALEIISQECTRVARIIDNLLDFAEEQRRGGRESLDLSQLVDGVLNLRQYAMETAGVEIQRDYDPSLSQVMGERGALQRLVLALLLRAERVLADQPPGRRLVVRTRESTDGVVLYVVDNGPGIPRERLRSLFTAPPGAESETAAELAGAMAVAREHGGHLWAESVQGEGTAFFVRLPRWEEPGMLPQEAGTARASAAVRETPARALRVLVADDEATLRLALTLFLGRHGYEVVQAADAYEGHRLAAEQHFDVVLADARMPGDGIALLEKLDAIPHLRGRTILMTGDHTHPFAAEFVRTGRPHLTKPFDMTEAIRLVESLAR